MTSLNSHTNPLSSPCRQILLACLLVLPVLLNGQTWERFYDFTDNDFFKCALPTTDGGVLYVGHSVTRLSPIVTDSDVLIVKVDRDGNLVWNKEYSQGAFEEVFRTIPTSDGNFLLGGLTYNSVYGNSDGWIIKIDQEGEVIWDRKYGGSNFERIFGLVETADGGFGFCGSTRSQADGVIIEPPVGIEGDKDSWIGKIDAEGNLLWNHRFGSTANDVLQDLVETPNGDLVAVGNYLLPDVPGGHWQISLYRTNANGNPIWDNLIGGTAYEEVFSIINTSDGGFAVGGITTSQGAGDSDTYLVKLTNNGAVEWEQTYGGSAGEFACFVQQMPDGGYSVLTSTRSFGSPLLDLYLIRTESDGSPRWTQLYDGGNDRYDVPYPFTIEENGDYLIVAQQQEKNAQDSILSTNLYVLRTDPQGNTTTNVLRGQLFIDLNEDCLPTSGEVGLEDWLVVAKSIDETFYATSDTEGNYLMELSTGSYAVEVIAPSPYWEACDDVAFLTIDNIYDTTRYDFRFSDQVISCPDLEVDLSTAFLSYCSENKFDVFYKNNGTITANEGFVQIILPENFLLLNSSIPLTSQNDQLYEFAISDLPVNTRDSFNITVLHDCSGDIVGQTHQLFSYISPDEICSPTGAWDNSSLVLRAEIGMDSVQFIIENQGIGDMGNAVAGVIIEDWLLPRTEPVQLNAFEKDTMVVYPEGKTVRLEIPQAAGHPGRSNPSLTVEGVGENTSGAFTLGYVNHYPEDDANPFKSIDAQISYENFLPNVLRAYPRGIGSERVVAPNVDIEYHLRFQHTGADTLQWLTIQDRLPAALNVETLRPGASSHHYDYQVLGDGIVRFNFYNINLVGNQIDSLKSYGFIKFRISQQPDLTDGTAFSNRLHIQKSNGYEFSNEVWHIVRQPDEYEAFFATACVGEIVNNQEITASGIYLDTVSVSEVNQRITVAGVTALENVMTDIDTLILVGQLFNNQLYENDTTIQEVYTAFNECDSLVNYYLEIKPSSTIDYDNTIFNLSLFPNPGERDDQVTVTYRLPASSPVTLKLYTVEGVLKDNIVLNHENAGAHQHQLDIELPAGLYWIELSTNSGSAIQKLIIR